jgi:hypothetical protein
MHHTLSTKFSNLNTNYAEQKQPVLRYENAVITPSAQNVTLSVTITKLSSFQGAGLRV